MKYFSTNGKAGYASLSEAVIKGLAPDKGLYMPQNIKQLSQEFFDNIDKMTLQEISYEVATAFFGDDIPADELKKIVYETMNFEIPVSKVADNIYSLELYHGPTLAFKDVGARFMARMLGYFVKNSNKSVNVLVATSGDTGSAVANGFLGVDNINVYVLYPKGKVSEIQEKQFTTLKNNIVAIEVDGCFDDCQALVKQAFMDEELNRHLFLTSANSINLARFLPQSFYYFWLYAQMKKIGCAKDLVISVPSGNFGNLTAGLFAKRMGLPIKHFIAANNSNDIVYNYLQSGEYNPRPSISTIANAMDVGNPSNFARIMQLYDSNHSEVCKDILGATYNNLQISDGVKECLFNNNYLLDPHGACGYLALKEFLQPDETGLFLETAHPAKFKDTIEDIIQKEIEIPPTLQEFMKGEKDSTPLENKFSALKSYLLNEEQNENDKYYN